MKKSSLLRLSLVRRASRAAAAVIVLPLIISQTSPSLQAQSQSKPTPFGVRSAAPASVPGQSVQTTAQKNYWVGRALSGGYMGVWSQLNPDHSANVVKFAISPTTISAISSKRDSSGAEIASGYTVVFLDQSKAKADTVLGFTHSVGPKSAEKARAQGSLPATLPAGLKRELLELGTGSRLVKQLQNLIEAKNAADAFAGAMGGDHPMPTAIADPFLKRSGLPGEMRGSPTAGLPGRDGRATDDGPAATLIPLDNGVPGAVGPPKDPNAPLTVAGAIKLGATTSSDSQTLDRQETGVTTKHDAPARPRHERGGSPPAPTPTDRDATESRVDEIIPSRTNPGFFEVRTTERNSNGETHVTYSPMPLGIRDPWATSGSGTDPRKNPSEGGGHGTGIDPQTWKLLRGTGLGGALYNSWVQKKNHDFPSLVSQPPRDDEGLTKPGSSAPRLGRDAYTNPGEFRQTTQTGTPRGAATDPAGFGEGGSGHPTPIPVPHR